MLCFKGTSLSTLSQILDLENLAMAHPTFAEYDKQPTVVGLLLTTPEDNSRCGQVSLTLTNDRRLLITLNVGIQVVELQQLSICFLVVK